MSNVTGVGAKPHISFAQKAPIPLPQGTGLVKDPWEGHGSYLPLNYPTCKWPLAMSTAVDSEAQLADQARKLRNSSTPDRKQRHV